MSINVDETLIGKRIKETRERKRMSQQSVSDETGISTSQISGYENGKKTPGLISLARIAVALGTSIDYLVFGSDAERPITTASDEEEVIVNCLAELHKLGVVERKEKYFPGTSAHDDLFVAGHRMAIIRLLEALDEFELTRETFPDPKAYLESIKASVANEMRAERKEEKASTDRAHR